MCRNIRTLLNLELTVTKEHIRAASLQFVRKISGFNTPSKPKEAAFFSAVDKVARISGELLASLKSRPRRSMEQEEAPKARTRSRSK